MTMNRGLETGIGRQPSTKKISDDRLGAEAGKRDQIAITVCHCGGLSLVGLGFVAYPNPTKSKATALYQIQIRV